MPSKSLYLLGLCTGSAIVTGIGRFVVQSSLPQALLDGLFLLSVVAAVSISVYIVVRAISRHAQNELADIDEKRPPE